MAIDFNDSNIQALERIVKQAFSLACNGNNDALEVIKPLRKKEIMFLQQAIFECISNNLLQAEKRKSYYELE